MLTQFEIKNFRGFSELDLHPSRIGLVTGRNNVGKTALLEALFLHLGAHNPELPTIQVNAYRGITRLAVEREALWAWLFHEKDLSRVIELVSTDDSGTRRELRLRVDSLQTALISQSPEQVGLPPMITLEPGAPSSAQYGRLVLEYTDSKGRVQESEARAGPKGLEIRRGPEMLFPLSIYLGSQHRLGDEEPSRFSRLEEEGRDDQIVEALRLVEPRLRKLSVAVVGSNTTLRAEIGAARPIPLAFLGEGTCRLLAVCLAIASCPGGVVLVDEIENGIHYSAMKGVWEVLSRVVQRANAQLIATTHSLECIAAANAALGANQDFGLIRLDRRNGKVLVTKYDEGTLRASLEHDLEVR